MNWQNRILVASCVVIFACVGQVPADDTPAQASAKPARFSQLLQVGKIVLLRSSPEQSQYTAQLLTDEQAEAIQNSRATYEKLQAQLKAIEEQLGAEKNLSQRARLFLEFQSLAKDVRSNSGTARLDVYAYTISAVGEDFVTLNQPEKVRYVPLRSIREIFQAESLPSQLTARTGRGFSLRGRDDDARTTQIPLKYAQAKQVAKVLDMVHPDPERTIEVVENANLLLITAKDSQMRQVRELIEVLDSPVTKPEPQEKP